MHFSSNSSVESDLNETGLARRSSESASSYATPPSSASQSSKSSIKSSITAASSPENKRPLKSALKTHKSSPSLGVRFSLPERPPDMLDLASSIPPPSPNDWPLPLRPSGKRMSSASNVLDETSYHALSNTQTGLRMQPMTPKRFSVPAKISRNGTDRTSTFSQRYYSSESRMPTPRVTSYQSTASAPAVLDANPTPPSPSQPPSQYSPLEHYIPCLAPSCNQLYTSSLLGPTFYLPQQPHQLVRKKGFCARCANRELKLANDKVKQTFEFMRQNAGRKTLGQIAVEFEIWKDQYRQERALESESLAAKQNKKLLKTAASGGTQQKGKAPATTSATTTDNDDEAWDWRYTPRPCTRKDCNSQWFSPFDNKLYLLYHTPRPSGLTPLPTLCPGCARSDVEAAEERIQGRKSEGGAVWEAWCEEVRKDREMEVEFWEKAQEKLVREQGVVFVGRGEEEGKAKGRKVEKRQGDGGEKIRKGKFGKLRGGCVVM